MKTVTLTLLASMLLLMMTSCADDGTMTSGGKGSIGGAAGGAVIGQALGRNRYATVMVAAMGGILGYLIGEEMDKSDTEKLNRALESGEAGKPISWKNPDTGDAYQVIPQDFYTDDSTQQKCRNADLIATLEGKEEKTKTKACRSSDGHWVLDTVK